MRFSIIFGLAAVLFLFEPCVGFAPYIGCFHDDDASPDLNAPIRITFAEGTLTVAECTQQCRESGFAYAGIRRATTCYCGNSYGRYGPSDTIYCNFTCEGVSNLQFCGGVTTNSIYYSIDMADHESREYFAHGDVQSFDEARRTCVGTDGDLATMADLTALNGTLTLFNQYDNLSSDQRMFWIGLKWQFMPDCGTAFCDEAVPAHAGCDDYFQWVIPQESMQPFDCDAAQYADVWGAAETQVNDCVTVDIDTGAWHTDSCYAERPFLCFSRSMGDEEEEDYPEYDVVVKKDKDEQNLLSLYIILPFFILLYGGSCVLYCVHKIYRNCKRYRKANMLLEHQEDFTEFEPDNKPMKHRLMGGPDVAAVPAVLIRKGNVAESRPTTSGAVEVDVASDLPSYYKKTSLKEKFQRIRAEKRRDKLLENALKESRARRAKEISNVSNGDESTGKTTPVAMPIESKPRSYSRGRSRNYIKSPPAAFSPSMSLLDERKSESPDDPTMMSIADIMRVKMMMKEKKKRVRKILSS